MYKKFITLAVVAFTLIVASNAHALIGKGKFNKKAHKIKGSWALLEIEGHQVISFHDNFKTKDGADLKLILSKKEVKGLKDIPTFDSPVSLGAIKSNTGDQHYIIPKYITIEDYKSVLIYNEETQTLWGGFDIPEKDAWKNQENQANNIEDRFIIDDKNALAYGS